MFGPSSDVAVGVVNTHYAKLLSHDNRRVSAFFAQWNMIFGVIYGQELEKGDAAAKELAKLYKIQEKPDLKKLLFAVHTCFHKSTAMVPVLAPSAAFLTALSQPNIYPA